MSHQEATTLLPPAVRQVLDSLDEAVFSSRELQKVLDLLLHKAVELLGAEYGSLRGVNCRTNELTLVSICPPHLLSSSPDIPPYLDISGPSVMARVVRDKAPLCIADLQQSEWWQHHQSLVRTVPIRSELAVPLLTSDGRAVVGVLNVESPRPHAFQPAHQDWLLALARRAQVVVQRTKLSHITQTLATSLLAADYERLLEYTVTALSDLMQVPVCSIWLYDDATRQLLLKKAVGRPEETADTYLRVDSFLGQVLTLKTPVSTRNVLDEPIFRYRDLALEQGWMSALVVPILAGADKVLGLISVYSVGQERIFTEHDHHLAAAFADRVALALQQAALLAAKEHALAEKARALEVESVLHDVSRAVVMSADGQVLLNQIVQQAVRLVHGSGGILYLLNVALDELIAQAAVGSAAVVQGMRAPLRGSLSGWVAANRKAIQCAADDRLVNPHIAGHIGARYYAAVPLEAEGQVIGTLVVADKQNGTAPFDTLDLDVMQVLANHAVGAINRKRLIDRLQRHAEQRHLTNQILSASVRLTNIQNLFRMAARGISRVFGYRVDLCAIEHNRLVTAVSVDYDTTEQPPAEPLAVGDGITGMVAATGQPQVVPDVTMTPRYVMASPTTKAELAVPLQNRDHETIGVLNIESQEVGTFSHDDLQIFQPIADGIALAIDNVHHRESISIKNRRLRTLLDVTQAAFRHVDQEVLLAEVARHTTTLLASTQCAIHLFNDRDILECRMVHAESAAALHIYPNKEIIQEVAVTGQRHIGNPPVSSQAHEPSLCLMSAPLKAHDRILGVISVSRLGDHTMPPPYTPEDYEALELLASILTLHWENHRLHMVQQQRRTAEAVLQQTNEVSAILGHKLGSFLGGVALNVAELDYALGPGDATRHAPLHRLREMAREARYFLDQFQCLGERLRLHPEVLSVGPLVDAVLARVPIPPGIWVSKEPLGLLSVRADRRVLDLVINNLICNALEAMPHGGSLAIRGGTTRNHTEAWLEVSDTGYGIAPERLPHVFEPFYTTKGRERGMGIGLWLAQWYLQALGGDITVESTVGQGAHFTIHLPAVQTDIPVPASAPPQPGVDNVHGTPMPQPYGTPRVLVIDDEPTHVWCEAFLYSLERRGCAICVAQNRDEARAWLRRQSFDAFVVDIRLGPDQRNQEGLECVAEIRGTYPEAPIFIVSAYLENLAEARKRYAGEDRIRCLWKADAEAILEACEMLARSVRHESGSPDRQSFHGSSRQSSQHLC